MIINGKIRMRTNRIPMTRSNRMVACDPSAWPARLLIGIIALLASGIASAEIVNLAVLPGAKATQSSTAYGGDAILAIDGLANGDYEKHSVTHTGNQADAWWQVTLSEQSSIDSIVLWNRTDGYGDRLSNIRVTLLGADGVETWTADYAGPGNQKRFDIDLPDGTEASVVKIQFIDGASRSANYLSLAEVQVMGEGSEWTPEIIERHDTTVVLTTQQVVKENFDNTTSNPRRVRRVMQTSETFNSKQAVERIVEQTKSTTYNVSGSLTAGYSGKALGGNVTGSASASMSKSYSDLVKSYYRTTGEVETFKSKESITTDELVLNPGDEVVVYTNTTSGGSYTYSWDTSEKLTAEEMSPETVTLDVIYNLTPAFNKLMQTAMENNTNISKAKDEWNAYSEICQEARVLGIRHYIRQVQRRLWTDGLDQYSWEMVMAAANRADETPDDAQALAHILLGFYNITEPAHNHWAWIKLTDVSREFLATAK
jgi:hypothetical protein